MKKLKKENKEITEKIIDTFKHVSDEKIPSDVQGSYTGVPLDGKKPIQDADDL